MRHAVAAGHPHRYQALMSLVPRVWGRGFPDVRGLRDPQQTYHLIMHAAVGGQHIPAIHVEWAALRVADAAAGLLDQQRTSGVVPGVETGFPERTPAACRDIRQVQDGGPAER